MIRRNAQAGRRSRVQCTALRRGMPAKFRNYGMPLWVRADLGITLNAGDVSAWSDKSGTGNDLVQATGAKQPLWLAADIHGQPSIQFTSGNSDNLSKASVNLFGSGPYTIFILAKADSLAATTTWFANSGGGDGVGVQASNTPQYDIIHYGVSDHFGGTPATTSYEIQEIIRATASAPTLKINGTAVSIGANATDQISASTTVSVGSLNGAAQFYSGRIAEVICYSTSVSATSAAKIRRYMSARYAIAVT